ncbi:MAG TPA: hypothetical protein VND20_00800 [Candidatus Binataceae bacterium]|nr:hypothetical protein [Candidatus Binataceae bacterium]
MSDGQRYRRADPDRDGPLRNWSKMMRPSGSAAASTGSATPSAPADPHDASANGADPDHVADDTVAGDIATAYRVIDEHLRAGQRAAEDRAGGRAAGPSSDAAGAAWKAPATAAPIAAAGLEDLIAQGMRFYSIMVPLWTDFIAAVTASGAAGDFAGALGRAMSQAPGASDRRAAAIAIEVTSCRPAEVTLDLPAPAIAGALTIAPLRALEPDRPPLAEVALVVGATDGRTILRVRISDTHPPGLYTGLVVDRLSGEPRGTVSVRLGQ